MILRRLHVSSEALRLSCGRRANEYHGYRDLTASLRPWRILVVSGAHILGTAVSPTFEELQLLAAIVWQSGLCSATSWLRIL